MTIRRAAALRATISWLLLLLWLPLEAMAQTTATTSTGTGKGGAKPTRKPKPSKPVDTAWTLFCMSVDADAYFCGRRQPAPSDAHKYAVLEAYCNINPVDGGPAKKGTVTCEEFADVAEPVALTFQHKKGEWLDNGGLFKELGRKLEIDPATKVPTAHLRGGDRIGITIVDTNGLVHAANRGEAREENIAAMKELERVVDLLGGALGPLVNDAGVAKGVSGPGTTSESDDRARLKAWAKKVNDAREALQNALTRMSRLRGHIQLAAQMLEVGPAPFEGTLDEQLEMPDEWRKRFAAVEAAWTEVAKDSTITSVASCAAIFDAFLPVLSLEKPMEVEAAALKLVQQFDEPTPPCGTLTFPAIISKEAKDIRKVAADAVKGEQKELAAMRKRQIDSRGRYLANALALQRIVSQFAAVHQSIRDILAKEEDTRKAAVALRVVADRVRDAGFRRKNGKMYLVDRIYLPDEIFDTSWTKARVTALKIAVNSPYADQVTLTVPKETSTSYRLVRKNYDRFGVSAGLVYTRAANVTYVAVDPDPTRNVSQTVTQVTSVNDGTTVTNTSTQTTTPELKSIAEKERQTRAGSFGVFANYRLAEAGLFGFGFQGGVAASTDNPAFFGGLSMNVGSYLVVGAGCGAFRVKTLGDGPNGVQQRIDDKVMGSDDIRLKSRWSKDCRKGNHYFSFAVNIMGLPLFSAK